jgi:hypothetical protein
MKKFLILFTILFLFSVMTFAQMQVGLKAGLNISNLAGNDVGNTDSKTGFVGGAFFMYQFNPLFAVQPEAYYTMKGATQKGNIQGYDYTSTLSFDYIEIPILLKLIIPLKESLINPVIFGGPSFGLNTTHKVKAEVQGISVETDIPDTKLTDFGLVFGGGVGFPVGTNELGFDIRYILGLGTIDDSSDPGDVKNGVINFNAYFGFLLN